MFGSAMSMLGYYVLSFLFLIWMVIKIGHGSVLMAVLCFVFPPLAIIPLVRNWGDPDTDIRIPFLAFALTTGLATFMAYRTVDKAIEETALYLSDDEIAEIAAQDPATAARIIAARDEAVARGENLDDYQGGWDDEDGYDDEFNEDDSLAADDQALERAPRVDPNALPPTTHRSRQRAAAPLQDAPEAFQSGPLRQQAARIAWRFGSTSFAAAHAELRVPKQFRFAPRFVISQIARLRGTPLEPVSLGWVVHRQTDLAHADAWYVEAFFIEGGHLELKQHDPALPEQLAALGGQALADDSGRTLGSGDFAPTWLAEDGVMTWSVIRGDPAADHRVDVLAAKPLRHGVLLYVVRELAPAQQELGLRATRLMALQTHAEPQWAFADFRARRDASAALGLIDWMRGVPYPAP